MTADCSTPLGARTSAGTVMKKSRFPICVEPALNMPNNGRRLRLSLFSCLRLRQWPVTYLITISDWLSRSVIGTENTNGLLINCLMKLVILTICNFCFSGTDNSKFYSDMWCALPEAYEKFQWVFHYSLWITELNWIKHVLEGNLQAFTPAH